MASPSVTLFAFFSLLLCSGILAQDYFLYLRWPGGICVRSDQCCFPSTWPRQDDFMINYLAVRANNSDGDFITCSETQFYVNTLQLIIEDLYAYWPSLTCPSDPGVREWQSAWEVNGACTGLLQKDYFNAALALRASANLLPILANKGIVPSNHKSYKLSEVENAINGELGGAATLNCGSKSSSLIKGVRLCVDETATRFVECPVKRASTCAETVRLEPLAQVNDEL